MFNGFQEKRASLIGALLLLCLILLLTTSSYRSPSMVIDGVIDFEGWSLDDAPVIELTGQWHFFPDQLATPPLLPDPRPDLAAHQQPSFELQPVPSTWNNAIAAKPWPHNGHGTGTYWLRLIGSKPAKPVSLAINRVCSSASIFFFPDGAKSVAPLATLGTVGASAVQTKPYAGSTTVSLPFTDAKVHHLLIQVANFDFRSGGLCGDISLGETGVLNHQHARFISLQSMLIATVGIAALYLFALLSQNKQNSRAFWLMLMCLGSCVFFLAASGLLEQLISSQSALLYVLRSKLIFIGLTLASTSLLMFYTHHFPHYLSLRLLHTIPGIMSAMLVLVIALPTALIAAAVSAFAVYWGIQLGLSAWLLGRAMLDRRAYARPMLIALAPLLFAAPVDAFRNTALNEMPMVSLYCLVFFIFVHSLIIGRKFTNATTLAEKLSLHLKDEVEHRTAELHDKNRKLEQTQRELQQANNALKKLSITDGLTRIYNRMHFEQEFRKEWRRAARLRKSISILMIDVDHFKELNDSAGHLAGDQALQSIASVLHNHFKRAGELVARYGGEEFVVMLPNTDQRKALAVAEGLRSSIEKLVIEYNEEHYRVTISLGISTTTPSMKLSPDHLLAAADAALYEAKSTGRNRVEIIPLLPSSLPYGKRRSLPG